MAEDGMQQLAAALELVRRHREAPAMSDAALLAQHPELREVLEPLLAAPPPDAADGDDAVLGDFRLVRRIGRGGMGEVHEAVQLSLGRRVALKLLPFERAGDPAALARFRREAQLLAGLRHDHLVAVHASGEAAGQHFFAMDLVDGASLAAVLERLRAEPATARDGGGLARALQAELGDADAGARLVARDHVAAAIVCLLPVAEALAHVHEHGIVHRDVKPANILLRRDGTPLLGDFGLARSGDGPGFTQTGDFAGTPHYVSPEQITGGNTDVDERTDVFALGATLYELLTLRRPFDAHTTEAVLQRVLRNPPANPRRLGVALPDDVLAVLDKALQKARADRYPNMAAFAGDLRALRDLRAVSVRRPAAWTRLRRYARREPLRAGFVATLLLLLPAIGGLAAYLAWQQPRIRAAAARELALQVEDLLEAGYLELGDGNVHVAVRHFLAAERLDAARPETLAGLVLAYDRLGRRDAMQRVRERLGATHPLLQQELAGLATDGEATAAAHRAVVPAATGEPGDALGWYVRGMRWLEFAHRTGDRDGYERAAAALRECMVRTPVARALYHCQYLHVLAHLQRPEPIVAWEAIVADLWPAAPIAAFWRGFALEEIDRVRARELLQRAVAGRADLTLATCALARTFEADNDWAEARRLYERVLVDAPDEAVARCGLARAMLELGDAAAALAHADHAARVAPDQAMPQGTRAAALLDLGRHDEGLGAADASLALVATDPEVHLVRCRLLTALSRIPEAIAAAAAAERLLPRSAEPHLVAAHAHAAGGDAAGARDAMRRVVALQPARVDAWLSLGWHCLSMQDIDGAHDAFERGVTLAPADPFAQHAMGTWHSRHGERTVARVHFERAIALDPKLAPPRVNLAALLWTLGEREASWAGYRDAVACGPDNESASEGLVFVAMQLGRRTEAVAERKRWAEAKATSPLVWLKLAKTCLDAEHDLELAALAVERAGAAAGGPRADVAYWHACVRQRQGAPAGELRQLFEQAQQAPHCSPELERRIAERLRALD